MKSFRDLPTFVLITLALALAIVVGAVIGMAGAWDVKL